MDHCAEKKGKANAPYCQRSCGNGPCDVGFVRIAVEMLRKEERVAAVRKRLA
jgi:hypothetical protein